MASRGVSPRRGLGAPSGPRSTSPSPTRRPLPATPLQQRSPHPHPAKPVGGNTTKVTPQGPATPVRGRLRPVPAPSRAPPTRPPPDRVETHKKREKEIADADEDEDEDEPYNITSSEGDSDGEESSSDEEEEWNTSIGNWVTRFFGSDKKTHDRTPHSPSSPQFRVSIHTPSPASRRRISGGHEYASLATDGGKENENHVSNQGVLPILRTPGTISKVHKTLSFRDVVVAEGAQAPPTQEEEKVTVTHSHQPTEDHVTLNVEGFAAPQHTTEALRVAQNTNWCSYYSSLKFMSERRKRGKIEAKVTTLIANMNHEEFFDRKMWFRTARRKSRKTRKSALRTKEMEKKARLVDLSPLESNAFFWLKGEVEKFDLCGEDVEGFPHIVATINNLARLYARTDEVDKATELRVKAMEAMFRMARGKQLYQMRELPKQYEEVTEHLIRERIGMGALHARLDEINARILQHLKEGCEREGKFRKEEERIRRSTEKIKGRSFERYGNIGMVYFGLFLMAFLLLRCYIISRCSGEPQEVIIDEKTFRGSTPTFKNLPDPPECAQCKIRCFCSDSDLTCPDSEIGTKCLCQRPMCDACNICGSFRVFVREWSWVMYPPCPCYFSFSVLEIALFAFALLRVAWPYAPIQGNRVDRTLFKKRTAQLQDSALMIAHYGDRGPLEKTLREALNVFKPSQIYVCHNAAKPVPFDKEARKGDTLRCCVEVTEEWYNMKENMGEDIPDDAGQINYAYICEGNKTLAFYVAALMRVHQQYICIIDNDVMLPPDMEIPIHKFEEDDKVQALAFTICAENTSKADGSINWLTSCQDIEYKKAGIMKMFQSKLGSAFYAHGAIAMWRKEMLLRVLKRHNTMFHGEDLQMGAILHQMNRNYKIKMVGYVSIPTIVPSHLICLPFNTQPARRDFPGFFRTLLRMAFAPYKCTNWGCGHQEKSLFVQRVKSWDAAAHRVMLTFLSMLLFYWKRVAISLKPFLLYEIWAILQDWIRFPLIAYIFLNGGDCAGLAVVLVALYVVQILVLLYMDLWIFRNRRDMQTNLLILLSFPFYNVIILILRFLGLWYNAAFYLPKQRNAPKVKNRATMPKYIDGKFITLNGKVPPPPGHEDMRTLVRVQDSYMKVNGARLFKAEDGQEYWETLEWDDSQWIPVYREPLKLESTQPKDGRKVKKAEYVGDLLFVLVLLFLFAAAFYLATLRHLPLLWILGGILGAFVMLCIVFAYIFG